jgi:hypothetical protein
VWLLLHPNIHLLVSGLVSQQLCPAGLQPTLLRFTHVVAQEHKYLFQGLFAGKGKVATLERVRPEKTYQQRDVPHFIGRLCYNSTSGTPHLQSGELMCYESVHKLTCICYENEEPGVPGIPEQTSFDTSPRNYTPSSEPRITSLIGCCNWPKPDVIPGKKLIEMLLVAPKFIPVSIVCLNFYSRKYA